MSKVIIPVSIDLGASLERIKAIETFLLKLVPASNQTVNKFKELKDVINKVDSGALGKVPDVFKQIVPPANEVVKALERFAASSKFVSALDQAVADATASVLQFAQGSASIEDLLPVLARLTQEAGGLEEGLSLLKDLPGFDEFTQGLGEGLDLLERFGDKALDINFDPNKTISTRLREAKADLAIVVAEFGDLSPEAGKAAEKVNELTDEFNRLKQLSTGADLGGKFELAGRALSGVASAFQSVTALQAAFGDKSKETEEALKKVQAVMALTQGIEGLFNSRKAIEALGASGVSAFRNLTTGIVTATGASRALATAIAATGIGLLVVGIGVAISAIDDYNSKIDEAAEATGKLAEENERLTNALKKTFASSQPELNRQAQVIANEEKIKDLQAQGPNNQKEINRLRRQNLEISIASGKAEIATLDGIANGQELLAVKAQVFRDEQELIRIGYEETAEAAKKAEEKEKKRLDELKKKAEQVLQVGENLKNRLKDIEFDVQFGDLEGQGLEQKLKAFQDAAKQYLKLGFTVDDARVKDLITRAKEINLLLGKELEVEILAKWNTEDISEEQRELIAIQEKFEADRKALAAKGITDFSALEAARQLAINKVTEKANAKRKEDELKNIIDSKNLFLRAELSAIKDSGQSRLQELRNAENKEMEELEKSYENKKISLEKFLQDQAAIERFYANERAATQTDSQKKAEEELKAFQEKYTGLLESGLEDAFEALGTAIGEGKDPFAALAKSVGTSLANFAIQLGKDLVGLGKLFAALKAALSGLGPAAKIGIGLALIAFGAAVKAAIGKRSKEQGFAGGGYIDGPGTETSDSIPARLSKGEYVIKAKSVRKYGARVMEKINKGQVPVASLARATSQENNEFFENIISRGRSGGTTKALVNRFEAPLLFSNGGYVDDFYENIISRGRSGGSSKALVNRFEVPQFFSDGGLVEATRQFTRHGGTSKALVNRFEMPTLPNVNMTETFQREVPYIATTKVSGQDLKIILERADRRYSNAT